MIEFILRYKKGVDGFQDKYRCVVPDESFECTKMKYQQAYDRLKQVHDCCYLLINRLDDNYDFVEVIQ